MFLCISRCLQNETYYKGPAITAIPKTTLWCQKWINGGISTLFTSCIHSFFHSCRLYTEIYRYYSSGKLYSHRSRSFLYHTIEQWHLIRCRFPLCVLESLAMLLLRTNHIQQDIMRRCLCLCKQCQPSLPWYVMSSVMWWSESATS